MLRALALVVLCLAGLVGADQSPAHSIRLLALGNSFSGNALRYLGDIANAAGCQFTCTHLMVGGSSLELHWTMAETALRDPADPAGLYGTDGRTGSLPANLDKGPWDAITIQQYSKISHDPATYRPFADKLVALIRQRAPRARVLFHQTWAYRNDDPRFGQDLTDADDMYRRVTAAANGVAHDLHLDVIPTGEAFHLVASDPAWTFHADPAWDAKTATYPALPDQTRSLNLGWQWTKGKTDGIWKVAYDGHHANQKGEYLAACVWFDVLFHRTPEGNTFRPKGLSDADARYLQGVAHRAAQMTTPAAAH